MALEQLELLTGLNKVGFAIKLLKTWEPKEGYYLADSGGVCSSATRDIMQKAKVKFDAHYCESPLDPPQIRSFLREYHPETQFDNYARNYFNLVVEKGLPMRDSRWCCEIIKEGGGKNRVVVVGNRIAEGNKRKHQCFVETPKDKARSGGQHFSNKTFVRPILQFTDYDLWQYIRENNVPYCSLYDEGATRKGYGEGIFKRLGCVLCPFSRNIEAEQYYFPKIVNFWKLACNKIVQNQKERGYLSKRGKPLKHKLQTGEELFQWWIARDLPMPQEVKHEPLLGR